MSGKPVMAAAPPTMAAVGLSWPGVRNIVAHAIDLIQTQGPAVLALVDDLMKTVKAVTGRDMLGVFAAINAAVVDGTTIADAIRTEFADVLAQ